MKSIIIYSSNEYSQRELSRSIKDLVNEYLAISVYEYDKIRPVAKHQDVSFILFFIDSLDKETAKQLYALNHSLPYIPCIALLKDINDQHYISQLAKTGILSCLQEPQNKKDLIHLLKETSDQSTSGIVKGIPLHSVLQIVENEKKTCTLKVISNDQTGYIFIDKGSIIAAESGTLRNEAVILELINWEETTIEIIYYNGVKKREIHKTTMSLIMEAFQLKDERENLLNRQKRNNKPELKLKYFPTSEGQLNLAPGNRVKMELEENQEVTFMGNIIGIAHDKYLIVSQPANLPADDLVTGSTRLICNYINLGKLCIFTSTIQHVLNEPENLLVIDYPKIVHYHELRKSRRSKIFLPCRISSNDQYIFHALIVDLSTSGCLCEVKLFNDLNVYKIDKETVIQIQFIFPGLKKSRTINGVIKNTQTSQNTLRLGIELIDLPLEIKEAIKSYLSQLEDVLQRE